MHLAPKTIAAAVAAAAFAAGLMAAPATSEAFGERQAQGGVVINAATTDGQRAYGAGTVISAQGSHVEILTAKHVAVAGDLTIRFDDGTVAPATVALLVPNRDLAVVSASVDPDFASSLHVAAITHPTSSASLHVWGSGHDGPSFEPGSVGTVGAKLPDGDVKSRYEINCDLCHQGDSGAGVFDENGNLIGVYVGFFEVGADRVQVAEQPLDDATLAAAGVPMTAHTVAFAGNLH